MGTKLVRYALQGEKAHCFNEMKNAPGKPSRSAGTQHKTDPKGGRGNENRVFDDLAPRGRR